MLKLYTNVISVRRKRKMLSEFVKQPIMDYAKKNHFNNHLMWLYFADKLIAQFFLQIFATGKGRKKLNCRFRKKYFLIL